MTKKNTHRIVTDEQHETMRRLAGTINMLRLSRKMSLRELAEKAGVGHSDLFRLENGNTPNPSIFLIKKVAAAFDLSIDELMHFDAKTCPTCGGSGWVAK